MPAFDRFLANLFAGFFAPDAVMKKAWKREKAGARLLRRKLRDAETRNLRQADTVARLKESELNLLQELAIAKQDVAQRTGQMEVLEAQIESLTAWQAVELGRLEAEAAIQATRKGLAIDKLMKDESD